MFSLLTSITILLYVAVALVLFLIILVIRSIFQLVQNKKEGPLSGRLQRTLQFLEQEGSVTAEEYQDYFGVAQEIGRQDLEFLEKWGFLEKVETKGQDYYRFIEKEKKS